MDDVANNCCEVLTIETKKSVDAGIKVKNSGGEIIFLPDC